MEGAERVTADTPEEARKILEGRGWTALKLHANEIQNFVHQDRVASGASRNAEPLSAEMEVAIRTGTAPGLWTRWSQSLTQSWWIGLLLVCMFIRSLFQESQDGYIWSEIWFVILLVWFFHIPVRTFWFRQTGREFRRLHRANSWHRWNEVLQCLDRLKRAQKNTRIGIGDASMARFRARALVGMGQVEEGLQFFRAAAEQSKMPKWLHYTFEAGLYELAKQNDKALELKRLALAEATDKSTVLIGIATTLVQRFDRPAEAREMLAQAEQCQLSEQALLHLPALRGKIAYREKDYAAADRFFRESVAGYENRPRRKHYLYEGGILTAKSYLAVCNAAMGKKDVAQKYFSEAGPYLKATGADQLLSQYEMLMGK